MNWVIVSTIHFSPSNDFFLPVMTFFLPAMPFSPTKEVGTSAMEVDEGSKRLNFIQEGSKRFDKVQEFSKMVQEGQGCPYIFPHGGTKVCNDSQQMWEALH